MTTRIDELPSTVLHSPEHVFPAMKDGQTVKLTVQQVIDLAKLALVDQAPEALDTLNELAAALGDDPNFSTTVLNSLASKLTLNGNLSDLTGHARKLVAVNSTETGAELVTPGIKVVNHNVDVDSTTYETGSTNPTTFKTYLISETVVNSSLSVLFKCRAAGINGTNSDASVNHVLECVDANLNVLTDPLQNNVILDDSTLTRQTDGGSTTGSDIYATAILVPPVLPQSAKIDLSLLGGSGSGWAIRVRHHESYSSTAHSSYIRLFYTEIENG